MSGIFIVGAKRTPFGAFGGALSSISATKLGVTATVAALGDKIDPKLVDQVYFGNVIQSCHDAAYLARHVALQSGCNIDTPSLTINRLCGSGLETVIQAAKAIKCQEANIIVAGGTENMSMAPLAAYGHLVRSGTPLGKGLVLTDTLWEGLTDSHAGTPMGVTAENLAKDYNITREQVDKYALRSQELWKKAHDSGVFQAEMAPTPYKDKRNKDAVLEVDEHPRPSSTAETLAKLPPVFGGVVTAANASGICDGAGSLVVASETATKEHGLAPLCRVVSYAVTGCDPTRMGIGPVQAIRNALAGANLTLADMDRIEINEAFAPQVLACATELQVDMDKLNVHGGAIALGHPLGASGSRILAHLAHGFAAEPTHKYVIGAACIGGGQGIAVVLER
uniref:Thiolase N-terminal domain-containing protein n=1 Tax=Amphora coffeiformis TaxID=265554 RepID=A0A7S3P4H0_9STRA|mmetsp:Transcript_15485/g.29565  ORF Transcript_15485/g.29565 Transcript_15485/m.29565 type:complete len:394 (-) Transcript_15485:40-1221(-)|eukprot:scaffold2209_cov168-Amphora_coffeaeformis.AAC.7